MILIKTYIAPSSIEGIGLFANEDIKKGHITWRYNPYFDRSFTEDEVNKMPQLMRKFINKYASLSKQSGKYILCNDDQRFINHSRNANIGALKEKGEEELVGVALRDIRKGEELTINYRAIDKNDEVSTEAYLNK